MTDQHDATGEYAIWHGPRMEYSPLPVAVLTDHLLAHATVRVYGYMLAVVTRPVSCNPGGRWILRRKDVMRRCRVGEDGWTRAVHELTIAGLYRGEHIRLKKGASETDSDGRTRLVGGQQRYVHHIFPASVAYGDDGTRLTTPPPGMPGGGVSPDGETPPLDSGRYTPLRKQHARAREHAAAAAQLERKEYARRPSGIETWWRHEHAAAQALEATESAEVISAAVAALRAKKKSAAPGSVRAEIDRQARERSDADARKKNDEAAARRKAEKEQRRAERASNPMIDLAAYQAALDRAGSHLDAVLRSAYEAHGMPAAWQPRAEWGLSDTDVAAIRAYIPDRDDGP